MSTVATKQKSARARAEARQQAQRRRLYVIAGSAAAVVAVVAVIVLVAVLGGSKGDSKPPGHTSGRAALGSVATVPQSVLDKIGNGSANALPQPVGESALTQAGKPLVFYVGAEYCPFCAAERWPFVQALSRFGTFHNLDLTTSGAADVHPNTPTFTFHGATYTSDYLSFVGKELYTNELHNGSYDVPLDKLTPSEEQIFSSHTNGFPFIDIGGRFIIKGATYDANVLNGLTATQIARSLADPTSKVAQAIDGAANGITAALCRLTDNQPADVCSAPAVTGIARTLAQ